MALIVDRLDWSPIYNAINLRRSGDLSVLRRDQRKTDAALALGKIALEAAGLVYDQINEARLAKAKLQAQDDELHIQQAAADAVLNDEVKFQDLPGELESQGTPMAAGMASIKPSGKKTLSLPQSMQDWFNQRRQDIEKEYAGFPQVRAWAQDQLFASFDLAKKTVLQQAYTRALQEKRALSGKLIEGALTRSTQEGTYEYVDAAIDADTGIGPAGKEVAKRQAHEQVDFGRKDQAVRAAATEQGYDTAIASVREWEQKGEATPEQARVLEQSALTASKTAAAEWQQRAENALQEYVATGGKDVEATIQRIVSGVPTPYRADTETLLRAQYQALVDRTDDAADNEMKQVWAKNEARPDVVLSTLLFGKDEKGRSYADRMKTSTYAWWHDRFMRMLSGGGGEADQLAPQAVQDELNAIISNNVRYPTNEAKLDAVNEIGRRRNADGSFVVSLAAIRPYRTAAGSPDVLDSFVKDALDRVTGYWQHLASKAKPGSEEERNAIIAGIMAKDNLLKYLKDGQRTEQQVNYRVLSLMKPDQKVTPKIDEFSLYRARTGIDKRRAEIGGANYPGETPLGGRAILTAEEKIAFEQGDKAILAQDYGIPEKNIVDREELPNGLSSFRVIGINPKKPDQTYWVTFTDSGKGNERLWILDTEATEKAGGTLVWVNGDTIPTLKQRTATAEEAARKAKVTEQVRQMPPEQRTAASILGLAATEKTTVAEAAAIATQGEPVTEEMRRKVLEQLQMYGSMPGMAGRQLRQPFIVQIAKETGLTEAMVLRLITEQGWQVVP